MKAWTLVIALFIMCVAASAIAQPPILISYQGKLVDASGVPVTGSHDLQFDLFAAQSGGLSLWAEPHAGVAITGGYFNVVLGGTTTIGSASLLDANAELWLEVTMDGTETFSRIQLVSAPYAMVATRLSGVNATAAQLNELVGGGSTTLHSHPAGDATTLDGLDSLQFLRADAGASYSGGTLAVASGSTLNVAGTFQLSGATVSATAAQFNELVGGGMTALHSHAAGDATTLDGLDSLQFLRSDAADICAGTITFTGPVLGGALPQSGAVYINPTGVTPASYDCIFGVNDPTTGHFVGFNQGGFLRVSGTLDAGNSGVPLGANRFGTGTPIYAEITDSNDLLVTDDLEVGGDLVVWSNTFCEGPLMALGSLSWGTLTRYYYAGAADFVPEDDAYTYTQGSNALWKDAGVGVQLWRAMIHLPQGATVTSFKIWYYDNDAADLSVQLNRRNLDNSNALLMGMCSSSGTPGESSNEDTTISYATVDNSLYAYYCALSFPADDTGANLVFHSALVTYTTTGP